MKKTVVFIAMAMVFGIFNSGILCAEDCKEGNEMLDKAFANAPDEMTLQYIEMATQNCPANTGLFKRTAEYYKLWYEKALNAEKQAEYKSLAQDYYRKAIATKGSADSKEMKTQLADLEGSNEFNAIAFRALRPSTKGNTGSGLNLDVHFARNSYKLTDSVQKHLDVLGKILGEQASTTISLEGHTDMTGSAPYNMTLSLKRAKSVRDFLEKEYGISSERINVSGYGFTRLADKKDPYSKANRRVEVIKLAN